MKYIGIISKTAFIFISAGFFSFLVSIFIAYVGDSYSSDYIDGLLSMYKEEGIPIPKGCHKGLLDRKYSCPYKAVAELSKGSISNQIPDLIEAVHSSCAFIIGALSFFLSIIIVYLAMILHRLKKLT